MTPSAASERRRQWSKYGPECVTRQARLAFLRAVPQSSHRPRLLTDPITERGLPHPLQPVRGYPFGISNAMLSQARGLSPSPCGGTVRLGVVTENAHVGWIG